MGSVETSPEAYPMMEAVLNSGARPIGFSWLAAVYSMMPNITDLTVFLQEGYNGINFAMGEGVETYHRETDSYENLNRSSAGQYLSTVLALADYAANTALDNLRDLPRETVYFPLFPGITVLMTDWFCYILCAAACALTIVLWALRIRANEFKISPSVVAAGLLMLLSLLTTFIFIVGSYLFTLPLLAVAITMFLKKWKAAYITAGEVSGLLTLLLWVPVIFLIWILLVQPMLL